MVSWMLIKKSTKNEQIFLLNLQRPRSLQQSPGMGSELKCAHCVHMARTPAWHPPAAPLAWKPLLALAPGDWSCETKGKGGSAAIWAPSTPAAVQSEKHRLCCLKHCPVLRQRWVSVPHTPLWEGDSVHSLPCYFWMFKEQSTNILLSSAQLVQRKQWGLALLLTPHTSSSLLFGSDWCLAPSPCYQEPNGFLFMSCLLSHKLGELLGWKACPLEQTFLSETSPPFSCDLLFIYPYWKAVQARDSWGSHSWKTRNQPWTPKKMKSQHSHHTSILTGWRPQLMACQSYIISHEISCTFKSQWLSSGVQIHPPVSSAHQ